LQLAACSAHFGNFVLAPLEPVLYAPTAALDLPRGGFKGLELVERKTYVEYHYVLFLMSLMGRMAEENGDVEDICGGQIVLGPDILVLHISIFNWR